MPKMCLKLANASNCWNLKKKKKKKPWKTDDLKKL